MRLWLARRDDFLHRGEQRFRTERFTQHRVCPEDLGNRQELIRQTEMIFEQDPPLLPVAWEKIDDIWYDYVKGLRPDDYFGAYDVCRQDTFWLDKT